MRMTAAILLTLAFIAPAAAEEHKILEPKPLLTTEQQMIKTLSVADRYGACPVVRMRNSLMDMFPAFLIDADSKKKLAEYRMSLLYGEVLRVSQLLPKDHPSKCVSREFVVHAPTGKLDVGAYGGCMKDDDELRLTDAYYFDPKTKRRMGREHKLKWDIAFRRVMWRTAEIAAQCPSPKLAKRS